MTKNPFRLGRLIMVMIFFVNLPLRAGPRVVGNGGDPLEIRFKEVSQDILQWIESGKADRLQLPGHITMDFYRTSMTSALKDYDIEFLDEPIFVNGAEKTCINFRLQDENQIRCNSDRFYRIAVTSPDDLYRLIHHEFAGLAGLEASNGTDSNYEISKQVTAFLADEIVRRLPVKPAVPHVFACSAVIRGPKSKTIVELKKQGGDFGVDSRAGVFANLYISTTLNRSGTGFRVQVLKAPYRFDRQNPIDIKSHMRDFEVIFAFQTNFQILRDGTKFGGAFFSYGTHRISVQCEN